MTRPMPHERRIEGSGTPEATWRAWPALGRVPVWSLDDWVAPGARLVVIAPHPDDEVIACGGLLHLHAARAGCVLVVAVTDGEASHAGSPTWTAPALAARRRQESAAGLGRLAEPIPQVLRLGLPDGGLQARSSALGERLRTLLRPTDRVVSTWRLDGHPDHEVCGQQAAAACTDVGCTLFEAPVWAWHWAAPSDARVPWQRLRSLRLDRLVRDGKQQALQAHRSQLRPRDGDDGTPVLGTQIVERVGRAFEYFFV